MKNTRILTCVSILTVGVMNQIANVEFGKRVGLHSKKTLSKGIQLQEGRWGGAYYEVGVAPWDVRCQMVGSHHQARVQKMNLSGSQELQEMNLHPLSLSPSSFSFLWWWCGLLLLLLLLFIQEFSHSRYSWSLSTTRSSQNLSTNTLTIFSSTKVCSISI